jgi:hypothetical protein
MEDAWESPHILTLHTFLPHVGPSNTRSEDPPAMHPAPAEHVFETRVERREAVTRQLAPDKGQRNFFPPLTHLASPLDHETARLSPRITHKATTPAFGLRLSAPSHQGPPKRLPAPGYRLPHYRLPVHNIQLRRSRLQAPDCPRRCSNRCPEVTNTRQR